MPLHVTPVNRNLQTRVTFMFLEFEDLFVVLGAAAVMNVIGHFVGGEIAGMPMNLVLQYGVPLFMVPVLMAFKYGKPRGYVRDPGDLVFTKHRYSAFSDHQFRLLLRERSITTIVTIGVDTHICVEGTVRQGYDLGYRMIVLSDLVATRQSELARHENSLALCGRYFALVLESDSFIELLQRNSGGVWKSAIG